MHHRTFLQSATHGTLAAENRTICSAAKGIEGRDNYSRNHELRATTGGQADLRSSAPHIMAVCTVENFVKHTLFYHTFVAVLSLRHRLFPIASGHTGHYVLAMTVVRCRFNNVSHVLQNPSGTHLRRVTFAAHCAVMDKGR